MEIKLTPETLSGKKLFCCTPMYGGQCYGTYMKSCLDLQSICSQYGVEVKFSFLFNESLIQRARNYLTDEFMRSDCSHMLFIDSDISFNAIDIIAMLSLDYDVSGAPYPKKSINWKNIKKAIMKNPNIDDGILAKLGGDVVFNAIANTTSFSVADPVEVAELGTGLLMFKRETFEKYDIAYPHRKYRPDHIGTLFFDGSREITSYFNVEIDPVSKRLISEDYKICHELRDIGVKIMMLPFMETTHTGTYTYQGSFGAVAQYLGELS